ncbi:lytic polysaccharide monooxygenase [Streptomyces sp. NPDC020681]|uniref:lytic polysaccharide monooxygenase n=1 Tax=Streptomyces sp. NPDC020681 TaxID=3365083 RepID=UPI0037A57296
MTSTAVARSWTVLGLLAGLALPSPNQALAHGAPTIPVSRSVACVPETGRYLGTPACSAAAAASDPGALYEWDNVRVTDAEGKKRKRIPDGRLCSAGQSKFRGLDLARDDWPVTELIPGADFAFRYATTVQTPGRFELYVTNDDYDSQKPLKWSHLETEPFLTVTDPVPDASAYTFTGQLPMDKVGRHLILTVWRNSDMPDTYYSCSDVHFRADDIAAGRTTPAAGASDDVALASGVRDASDRQGQRGAGWQDEFHGITLVSTVVVGASLLAFLVLACLVRGKQQPR